MIFFSIQWYSTQQAPCLQSVKSKKAVGACPTSRDEWESAARKKNCEILALQQTCINPDKFKYHCVINSYRNETVEVCAPTRIIIGYGYYMNYNSVTYLHLSCLWFYTPRSSPFCSIPFIKNIFIYNMPVFVTCACMHLFDKIASIINSRTLHGIQW